MWDIDPAEIDRYLSGRPSREQEAGNAPPARSPRSAQPRREGTADQLNRLRRTMAEGREAPSPRQPQQRQQPERTQRSAAVGRDQLAPPSRQQPARRQQPVRQDSQPTTQRPRRDDSILRQDPFADASDVGFDDELYTDDPYIDPEYADEWDEPAPRRAPMSRPQIRISKPNIPRPTMPPAIANAAIVNDTTSLAMIGGGLLGLALMAIVVSNRMGASPDVIATHVSASGALEDMKGRNALWRIPLLSTMLMLMNIVAAWFFSTMDRFAARFMLGAALVVQFVAWVAVIRYLW